MAEPPLSPPAPSLLGLPEAVLATVLRAVPDDLSSLKALRCTCTVLRNVVDSNLVTALKVPLSPAGAPAAASLLSRLHALRELDFKHAADCNDPDDPGPAATAATAAAFLTNVVVPHAPGGGASITELSLLPLRTDAPDITTITAALPNLRTLALGPPGFVYATEEALMSGNPLPDTSGPGAQLAAALQTLPAHLESLHLQPGALAVMCGAPGALARLTALTSLHAGGGAHLCPPTSLNAPLPATLASITITGRGVSLHAAALSGLSSLHHLAVNAGASITLPGSAGGSGAPALAALAGLRSLCLDQPDAHELSAALPPRLDHLTRLHVRYHDAASGGGPGLGALPLPRMPALQDVLTSCATLSTLLPWLRGAQHLTQLRTSRMLLLPWGEADGGGDPDEAGAGGVLAPSLTRLAIGVDSQLQPLDQEMVGLDVRPRGALQRLLTRLPEGLEELAVVLYNHGEGDDLGHGEEGADGGGDYYRLLSGALARLGALRTLVVDVRVCRQVWGCEPAAGEGFAAVAAHLPHLTHLSLSFHQLVADVIYEGGDDEEEEDAEGEDDEAGDTGWVTDEALAVLAELGALQRCQLRACRAVTVGGVEALLRRLPRCVVVVEECPGVSQSDVERIQGELGQAG